MKNFLIFLILVFQISCGEAPKRWDNLPVLLDKQSINENILSNLNDVIKEYKDYFGVDVFEISENGDVEFKAVKFIKGYTVATTYVHSDSNGIIYSGEIVYEEKFFEKPINKNVIAHELFHLLGYLRHESEGLMKSYSSSDILNSNFSDLITDTMNEWFSENYEE